MSPKLRLGVVSGRFLYRKIGSRSDYLRRDQEVQIGVDERVETSVEDRLGIADAGVGAVVGDLGVWVNDITSDAAAESGSSEVPLELRPLFRFGLQLELQEPGPQDLVGGFPVLGLAALVLAGDDDPGWQVREPDRGIRLVDVLSPGPRRTIGVDPDIIRFEVDLRIVLDLRDHLDQREGGVPPVRGVERRDADEPVRAALTLEQAVGVGTLHFDRRVLDARLFTIGGVKQIGLEAAPLAPAEVHAGQHRRPVLRVDATFAGVDDQDRVGAVVGTVEGRLQLHRIQLFANRVELGLKLSEQLGFLFGHFQQYDQIVAGAGDFIPRLDGAFEFAKTAHFGLGNILVVPVTGFAAPAFEVGYLPLVRGEVKVAPVLAQCVQWSHGETE